MYTMYLHTCRSNANLHYAVATPTSPQRHLPPVPLFSPLLSLSLPPSLICGRCTARTRQSTKRSRLSLPLPAPLVRSIAPVARGCPSPHSSVRGPTPLAPLGLVPGGPPRMAAARGGESTDSEGASPKRRPQREQRKPPTTHTAFFLSPLPLPLSLARSRLWRFSVQTMARRCSCAGMSAGSTISATRGTGTAGTATRTTRWTPAFASCASGTRHHTDTHTHTHRGEHGDRGQRSQRHQRSQRRREKAEAQC